MGIVSKTPPARVKAFFDKLEHNVRRNVIDKLAYEGVELQSYVRVRGEAESWCDQSGNLRSSIGCALYEDGKKIVQTDFEVVKSGAEGAAKGREYVAELASKMAKGISLAVVAGMDYASHVEAIKGKDVLASAETKARAEIPGVVQDAIDDAVFATAKEKI